MKALSNTVAIYFIVVRVTSVPVKSIIKRANEHK